VAILARKCSGAELCEVQEKDLVGMGNEYVVHLDSLETVISEAKKGLWETI